MKKSVVVAAFGVGLLMSGLYLKTDIFTNSGEIDFASKSSKKSQRQLELSKAKSAKVGNNEQPVIMNDPAISQAWGIKKTDAERAWSISKGSRKIVVAVIDTGADVNHEDLKNNLWSHPITGAHGWNFVSDNADLTDNHGHGTHIAGIIGAEAGNNKGIAGIAPEVSLMILKYYDPKVPNTDNLKNTVNAIRYAIRNGANIINYSGGGIEFSSDEKAAIEEARQAGILFVAAAGNERSNSDMHKYFPADYGLSNIISVTAIDPATEVLASSNYGTETVDIAAPGQNVLSTLPNNSYGFMTGTSQATAFVTGAAVLVMARKPFASVDEVKKHILSTGDSQTSLIAKCRTFRKLNLYKAVAMLDSNAEVSGVVAANTASLKNQFVVDPTLNLDSNRQIANFGKTLVQKLEHTAYKRN